MGASTWHHTSVVSFNEELKALLGQLGLDIAVVSFNEELKVETL